MVLRTSRVVLVQDGCVHGNCGDSDPLKLGRCPIDLRVKIAAWKTIPYAVYQKGTSKNTPIRLI